VLYMASGDRNGCSGRGAGRSLWTPKPSAAAPQTSPGFAMSSALRPDRPRKRTKPKTAALGADDSCGKATAGVQAPKEDIAARRRNRST
jgi:hypothetical protein